jgi:acyl carrier protein
VLDDVRPSGKLKEQGMTEVEDKILALIRETMPEAPAELTLDASLEADLGLTSLDITEVVFSIEDAFDITLDFDASTASRFQTVRDVATHVEEIVAGKG